MQSSLGALCICLHIPCTILYPFSLYYSRCDYYYFLFLVYSSWPHYFFVGDCRI